MLLSNSENGEGADTIDSRNLTMTLQTLYQGRENPMNVNPLEESIILIHTRQVLAELL